MSMDYSKWFDWSAIDVWTSEECVCLLFGLDVLEYKVRVWAALGDTKPANWNAMRRASDIEESLKTEASAGILKSAIDSRGRVLIQRKEFITWAINKGLEVPGEFSNFVGAGDTKKAGKREKQIQAICEAAGKLGYELLSIPEEGKAKIKEKCLEKRDLFTDSGFNHAWKNASITNRISIENKLKYIPRNPS